MSVNNKNPPKVYQLQIDVPEDFVEKIILKGKKPSIIISKIIEKLISEIDIDSIIDYAEKNETFLIKKSFDRKEEKNSNKYLVDSEKWTYEIFSDYMEKLLVSAEKRQSIADLASMLIAYLDTSSRPTSQELREARGFGSSDKWYEELRTSKTRLTIFAKHLDLPSFFPRAYGAGMDRRHPMDEKIYKFLRQWFSQNKELAQKFRKRATPRSAD